MALLTNLQICFSVSTLDIVNLPNVISSQMKKFLNEYISFSCEIQDFVQGE